MKKVNLITILALALLAVGQTAQAATTTCDKYGLIDAGNYHLQNCVWGADTAQCITWNGGTSFTVSTSQHNQGTVAGWPSIYKGCHQDCTPNSGLPIQVSKCASANFSYSVSSYRPSGKYNVALESWVTGNADGSGSKMEIMIVLDYRGGMGPAGSQVGTFNGYNVYYANIGWNFVTYVKTGTSSVSGDLKAFINDAIARGYASSSNYIIDMEAGFELMVGGQGLVCNSFSFSPTSSSGGTLLSQGKPATASSTEKAGLEAAKAVDGSMSTRWSSAFSDPQ